MGLWPQTKLSNPGTTVYVIDDALKEFVESGVAITVGTAAADGRPAVLLGWGGRVHEDRSTLDIFVDTARAATPLSNIHATGVIAVTFGDPVSYRSIQLKGPVNATGPASAEDTAWVKRHQEAFISAASLVGDPPASITNLFMDSHTRITFTAFHAFDQTPGPDAGQPL